MNNIMLGRVFQVAAVALMAVVLLAFGTMANAADTKLDDDWHFMVMPYLWVPSVNGKMNIKIPQSSGSNDFNLSSSDILSNLSFAAMLSLEAQKGNWSVLADFMYVDFSKDNSSVTFPALPGGGLPISANTGLKATIFEIAPAYSLYRSESANFDVLAGVRYAGVDSNVSLDISTPLPGVVPSRNFSENKDLVDPIVGVKGKFELGKKWFVPYYFDAGGFGLNNEWSWQAFGGVGYRFSDLFSMVLAYPHLQYNFNDNKLLKDFYMSGAELGFLFRF